MVHDHAPLTLQPCVSAFDHPALGQDDKATGLGTREQRLLRVVPFAEGARAAHDLDGNVVVVSQPLGALAGVGAVGVQQFDGLVLGASLGNNLGGRRRGLARWRR